MSSTQAEVLSTALEVFGSHAENMLRTCIAFAATLPEAPAQLPHEWGLGPLNDPSPACLKLCCCQLAAAIGTLSGVPVTISTSALCGFVSHHRRVVRRDVEVLPSLPTDDQLDIDGGAFAVITADARAFAGGAWWVIAAFTIRSPHTNCKVRMGALPTCVSCSSRLGCWRSGGRETCASSFAWTRWHQSGP